MEHALGSSNFLKSFIPGSDMKVIFNTTCLLMQKKLFTVEKKCLNFSVLQNNPK